ncbi:MAG TPA: type II secretion system protein GspK [Longimicrobium sp.]|uniref:general secretion pathway protein GspK n=1 Tax=Longimicrobium sp. TaxID=2029185 RepID=UPI002ED80A39
MRSPDRRGFALVAVLWILVLGSALALEVHAGVRADQRAAANARAEARARWAARGALARAEDALRAKLAAQSAAGAPPGTDTLLVPALHYVLDEVEIRARVLDARSRVQLNLAGPEALREVFTAAGIPAERARGMAAAIVRWRLTNAPPFVPAVRTDAADEVLALPPRGAFGAVEGLRRVPGIGGGEYLRVAPYLTVASDGRINLNTAPVPVLRTLPGMSPAAAEAVVRRRRAAPFLGPYEVADALPRHARGRLRDEMAGFLAAVAFAPAQAELVADAAPRGSPVRARIRAVAAMGGAGKYVIVNVVER